MKAPSCIFTATALSSATSTGSTSSTGCISSRPTAIPGRSPTRSGASRASPASPHYRAARNGVAGNKSLRQVAAECSYRLGPDMRFDRLLTILGAALLAGCGDARPPQFEILVSTAPPDASCVLMRAGQPIATAAPTPAIAMIAGVPEEVVVQCRRPGFADAAAVLPPAV